MILGEKEEPIDHTDSTKKSKKRKSLIWIIILLILTGGGFWLVFKFIKPDSGAPRINPLNLVPADAFFILETEEPYSVWNKLAETQIWKTLSKDEEWKAYGDRLKEIEATLTSFNQVLDIIDDRSIYLSGHLYRGGSYDYLFVFDMEGMGVLRSWLKSSENLTKRDFNGQTLYEKLDRNTKKTLHFTFIDNYFIGSYTHSLVERSILGHQEAELSRSFDFIEIQRNTIDEGVVRLFLNYETLYPYLVNSLGMQYTEKLKENLPLFHSGFFFDVEESTLLLEGYSNYNDTLSSYLNLFESSGTGGLDIARILPTHTSIYFSIGFDEFETFYGALDQQLREDPVYGEEYITYTEKTEKYLNIDIEEDVASWIDDEIAVVQTEPEAGLSNIALVLKAKSDRIGKEKMDFLRRQIKRKTPVKFKAVDYKGYEINFMSVKGFFKLILGNLFNYFDRPYYTIIDQYVIFSNEPKVLRRFIDDYLTENTLDRSISYQSFIRQIGKEHSALVYLQLPLLVNTTGGILDKETIQLINQRRSVMEDFPQVAISLLPSRGVYQTRALISIDNMVLPELRNAEVTVLADTVDYDLLLRVVSEEQVEISAIDIELEDLAAKSQTETFADGTLKYEVGIKNGKKHGNYFEYYETGEIRIKGKYKNDLKVGVWKFYGQNGSLIKRERYREGFLVK